MRFSAWLRESFPRDAPAHRDRRRSAKIGRLPRRGCVVSWRWMPRSLDDVPDRLILFDGVCVLCCWWVRFVIERHASARFRFVAVQSIRGSALATRLAVDVKAP